MAHNAISVIFDTVYVTMYYINEVAGDIQATVAYFNSAQPTHSYDRGANLNCIV